MLELLLQPFNYNYMVKAIWLVRLWGPFVLFYPLI